MKSRYGYAGAGGQEVLLGGASASASGAVSSAFPRAFPERSCGPLKAESHGLAVESAAGAVRGSSPTLFSPQARGERASVAI